MSASENVRKLLDTFNNQALRMITGGVKTTPVLAMQLLCDLQSFTNIIEKNAAILFNRLIRLPNNSFWPDYDSDDRTFGNYQYPLPTGGVASHLHRWLTLGLCPMRWHWCFCHLFSFYLHAGPLTTHFDGEVEAIHIALQQLAARLPPIERAVILSDSTSALQDFSNYNENNCLRVQNCRELLGKLKGKIVFQWVPYHCGLCGNERSDFLAKKETGILQNLRRDLTLHSAKLEIKRIFRESFRLTASRVARYKPWSTLLTSPICVLCDTGQDMTAAHLDECSALNDLNCIVKRRPVPGRPRATTPAEDRFLALSARRRRTTTVPQLVADHFQASGRRISATTV
ncbi:uncharacterized protein LOC103524116 [Trichonephila clavipes]|nr:uncharacterized protein LOC103524116 [Trichonephila clavipes]